MTHETGMPKQPFFSDNALRILGEPVTGTLCIADATGMPNATPVWFLWHDEQIHVSTRRGCQKHVNALRAARGSFSVIDPSNSSHYVEIRGRLIVEDDPDYALRDEVVRKHGYPDGSGFDRPGTQRIVISLVPERVLGRH